MILGGGGSPLFLFATCVRLKQKHIKIAKMISLKKLKKTLKLGQIRKEKKDTVKRHEPMFLFWPSLHMKLPTAGNHREDSFGMLTYYP